jgi:hypothetical protein
VAPRQGTVPKSALGKDKTVMSTKQNKTVLRDRVRKLIAGTQKRFSNAQPLLFGNATYTGPQIIAQLTSLLDALAAVDVAKAAATTALKKLADTKASVGPLIKSFVAYLFGTFGDAADPLADFGLLPRKVHKLKVVEKAQVVAKVRATRIARHTAGPRQKKAVKGSVPTPPAPPSPAEPAAANATPGK